ncbi:Exocyst complex component EXO84A, partial [Bienertia sinuspersici]
EGINKKKNSELTKIKTWLSEFLETLEVLQTERRVVEALSALDEAEKVVEDANERGSLKPTMLISLKCNHRKQTQTASQSSIKGAERRAVILALKRLGDGPRAHSLLLNAHHQKLQYDMHNMKPAAAISSASAGAVYCTSLSQLVFSTIGQASSDSLTVFEEDNSYTSELVTWAVKQTEQFSVLMKRQSLTQSPASGNLRATTGCVQICLGHCSLLESSGLTLSLDLFEGVEPLETLQLVTPLLEGLVQVFNSYVNTLINSFPVSVNEANADGLGVLMVKVAETEAQQLALLANALLLADECLPRAAAKLLPSNQVDRLRDSFYRQHALELIFIDDDGYAEEPEWFTSSIFQELYMRLSQIASLASEMFVGRERFATLLLIRLTEKIILWVSDDQTF